MTEHETYDRTVDRPLEANSAPVPNEEYYRGPPRANTRRLGVALLIVGLIWLASITFTQGLSFGGGGGTLLDERFDGNRLEMDVGTGSVEVRPSDTDQIEVLARYDGGSAGDYDVDVRESGGTVRITGGARPCFFCSRDVQYEIAVPPNAAMAIKTVNGEIGVEGVNGAVTLNTTNGEIVATSLGGNVEITTVNGEVELNDIGGELTVTTTNGSVVLEDGRVSGATVRTTNGEVSLEGVANDLNLSTVNGEISVNDARDGRLRIETTNGNVEYAGSLGPGESTVTTLSGEVRLQLPENSGFTLEANSISGDLETDFELRNRQEDGRNLRGVAGDGNATLRIQTTNGDVNVEAE